METRRFRNRTEAGQMLADLLRNYAGRDDAVVLALPRGGVPIAYEVAKALGAPLEVFVVRKVGVPGHEELAMGAIASGGVLVLDEQMITALGITRSDLELAVARELRELARREAAYREGREPPQLQGKTVILVDDGVATGSTMRAAALAVRRHDPEKVVDEIVCGLTPKPFQAVGLWYEDFSQTSDEEVRELLARAAEEAPARS